MIAVRYVLPAVVVLAGVVLLAFNPTLAGLEGWALLTGAGLAILMLNWLYRVGVKGDEERDAEEAARVYFDEHGRWPDQARAGLRDADGAAEPGPGRRGSSPTDLPSRQEGQRRTRPEGRPGRPASMRPSLPPRHRRGPEH